MPSPAYSWGYCSRCGTHGTVRDDLRHGDAVCKLCGGDGEGNVITIVSGERRAREYPKTFYIPKREKRESLKKGDYAKIIIEHELDGSERIWVEIQSKRDDMYQGSIMGGSVIFENVTPGFPVTFGPEHVIDIEVAGEN